MTNLPLYVSILALGFFCTYSYKDKKCNNFNTEMTHMIEDKVQYLNQFCTINKLSEQCFKKIEDFREEQMDNLNTDLIGMGCN